MLISAPKLSSGWQIILTTARMIFPSTDNLGALFSPNSMPSEPITYTNRHRSFSIKVVAFGFSIQEDLECATQCHVFTIGGITLSWHHLSPSLFKSPMLNILMGSLLS